MKTLVAGMLMVPATLALAQETPATPKVEIGLNYSYTSVRAGWGHAPYNANGGFTDVEYNFNRFIGAVADLGANYSGEIDGYPYHNTTFEYLFGPRFNARTGRFNPYVQVLFGGRRFSNGYNPPAYDPRLGASQNNFAMSVGGGLNITLTDHLAFRPFQLDYVPTLARISDVNYLQSDLRYSAGLVFQFGSK